MILQLVLKCYRIGNDKIQTHPIQIRHKYLCDDFGKEKGIKLLVIPSAHDPQFKSPQLHIDHEKINDEQGVIDNWRRKDHQFFVSKML